MKKMSNNNKRNKKKIFKKVLVLVFKNWFKISLFNLKIKFKRLIKMVINH